jgi:hypothetical protein
MREHLEQFDKDQLIDILIATSKSVDAMDGVWFQAVEDDLGMDAAMKYDVEAWHRFSPLEARRIKRLLDLPDRAGLEGLEKALGLKYDSIMHRFEIRHEADGSLLYRIIDCRVQMARLRKGRELHPCKDAAVVEHKHFSSTIDDRITCECVSCYPDVTDETCSCAWRFRLDEGADA